MNIAQCLLKRARLSADLPALSFEGASADFGAIAERASRLAGAMRGAMGLRSGDRVLIYMENRPELLELLFGCWIAGLCAVPVNAKLHGREAAHIAGDSGASAVFADDGLAGKIAPHLGDRKVATISCDETDFRRLAGAEPIACMAVDPGAPAWIFYTSGTTGAPKGATLSHRNLLYMTLAYYADVERVEPGQTQLHAAPLSHGAGLYALPHLFGGGQQVILSGFDATEILHALKRYEGVSIFAAPTMVNRLVQAAANVADPVGNLRTILYGGAPMYVNDLLAALDIFGPRFFQLFGQGESPMTITGLGTADHVGDRGPAHLARLGSCGVARAGVEVRIVDEAGRSLPAGEVGEVVTRSACVMSGYWGNETATAAALRDGWLWTGDIGSLDEAGYLTLSDRSKDIIISGGTNIYPREIEEVLLRHPAVAECSVVGRAHRDWGEEVVAFVVGRPGGTPAVEELDQLCLERIARFKRPKHYRFVDALPKNNTGKVLKAELRALLEAEPEHA